MFEVKTDYISRDSNFKNIIELENSLREHIESVLFSKNITRNKLLNIIDSLKSNSKSNIDLKIKMNEQIAPGIYESLTQFETRYRSDWKHLTNKYVSISSMEINSATNKYYQIAESNKINFINKKGFSINNNNIAKACGWGYSICLAGATAGLGTPVCVLLCGTIQVAVGVECMRNYCEEN